MAMDRTRYKSILWVWVAALVVATLLCGVAICDSAKQGKAAILKKADESLRGVAELEVNRAFEELGIPYSSSGGRRKRPKRQLVSKNGKFEVLVDSMKEAHGLYSLENIGMYAYYLNALGAFPLKQIYDKWHEKIAEDNLEIASAFKLKIAMLEEDVQYKSILGDSAICISPNELGTYYLDFMYTMTLTVYLVPTFWQSADLTSFSTLIALCVWLVIAMGLLIWIWMQKLREKRLSAPLFQNTYQIGEYVFDIVKHTLTYQGTVKSCSPQNAKLLYAFLTAPHNQLTYDEIARACGWPLDSIGLDDRRRNAIRELRKLFAGKVEFLSLTEEKACKMVIAETKTE